MIAFAVDPVEPARERLPTLPLHQRLGEVLALGADGQQPSIDTNGLHPLIAAVHQAFADHRPLVLSPEIFALTLAQGVALHVRLHAEALRERLVRHTGRKVLQIETAAEPTSAEAWADCLLGLREGLAQEVGAGWGRFFGCGFSTSTPRDEVAASVVMLDAFSSYYDYQVFCGCGIPEITLLGTPEDWEALRERVEILPELGLDRWAESLRPILDQLVATASGRIDPTFWQEIYKPHAVYLADQVAGWVGRLFPYVGSGGRYDQPNPMLEVPHEEMVARRPPDDPNEAWFMGIGSITAQSLPGGTSEAVIYLVFEDGDRKAIRVEGGLLGVTQDAEGRLMPIVGFAVREGESNVHRMAQVVERIVTEHAFEPARPEEAFQGSAVLALLYSQVRSATLRFSRSQWEIRSHKALGPSVQHSGQAWLCAYPLVSLSDGRTIAWCLERWVVLPAAFSEPDERSRQALEALERDLRDYLIEEEEAAHSRRALSFSHDLLRGDVPVLRGSLVDILAHALANDGELDEVDELSALWHRLEEARARARR